MVEWESWEKGEWPKCWGCPATEIKRQLSLILRSERWGESNSHTILTWIEGTQRNNKRVTVFANRPLVYPNSH